MNGYNKKIVFCVSGLRSGPITNQITSETLRRISVNKILKALFFGLCFLPVAAFGADSAAVAEPISLLSIGVGLVIVGAGYGIALIGKCAVESMARQPESAGAIQTAMIISAALIEGVTFFALIVCLLTLFF